MLYMKYRFKSRGITNDCNASKSSAGKKSGWAFGISDDLCVVIGNDWGGNNICPLIGVQDF